jgi:hypothetical protein
MTDPWCGILMPTQRGYIDGIHGAPYIAAPWILWVASHGWAFPGIETELAQLRQEIATERLERQHLARLVDSLVKDHGGTMGPWDDWTMGCRFM